MAVAATCTPIFNFSGYYRNRASSIELPEAIAWFEHLRLSMQTVPSGRSVQYEVHATYTPPCCQDAEIEWTVSHPFDGYRRLRKQLMRRLRPNHICPAECKWLRSVIKNHFPKPKILAPNAPRTTEARRQSLIRILRTLQAALVNRGNQGCNVLVQDVCYDFASFILGQNSKLPEVTLAMALSRCSSDQSTRNSSASFSSDYEERCENISPFRNNSRGRGYRKSE
ncbi:hypothetical protein F441_01578 [Phytophthora nicotianae CJ01A1]|uniref:PX domain-containing protein n=6 Tax=Phytophthora nicotianae TaxID=4792 RepID=W2QSL4_PHYN3|nr:hypothetical protein PPTG_06751 [Phytophthora nicotianae INRA-310]ETI55740.1 hypothetical protein F443_01616 [Phytophthora nicotianae P1569]ETK95551.1 hypothetical protein L915_01531 [Phytophthora nicotianae]ETO84476.1 hypothetical protein F444_01618 [Phytophthora nicotianae P1976]ETP25556.1 hypothetical protein F441_01578 [Phytophthora nicotianae CJ01A1]ETP53553.1 hypothetical protein F442_01554 [Phytophthora nicotianae P10297]KUF87317.1 hypothetical protein AM587_10013741 [Phytophthora n